MNLHTIFFQTRGLKTFVIGLLVILMAILICISAYKIVELPRYITLAIPSPLSYLPHGGWSYTSFTTQLWSESDSRYFIWRSETDAYSKGRDSLHGFESWDSVVNYFNSWLVEQGWVVYESLQHYPCRLFLPESKFLPAGNNGFITYRQPETTHYSEEPTICLAVWPVFQEGKVHSYHIVIVTSNPSPLTIIRSK